jgi:hypothetical protein
MFRSECGINILHSFFCTSLLDALYVCCFSTAANQAVNKSSREVPDDCDVKDGGKSPLTENRMNKASFLIGERSTLAAPGVERPSLLNGTMHVERREYHAALPADLKAGGGKN